MKCGKHKKGCVLSAGDLNRKESNYVWTITMRQARLEVYSVPCVILV